MSEKTTKACPCCGVVLPEEAAFCPCCTASLIRRHTIPVPSSAVRHRRRVGALCALVALLLPVLALLCGRTASLPPPDDTLPPVASAESGDGTESAYENLCQTYYEGEDGRLYHVFAAFGASIDGGSAMQGYRQVMIRANTTDCGPLTLFVEDAVTGQNARGSFYALMEDWDLTITASDGGDRCTTFDPTFDYAAATDAMLYQEMQATDACRDNDIRWTLRMKNGDAVTVQQRISYRLKTEVEYHWEDIPMSTAEQLQTLLDDIAATASDEEAVCVYLPAVSYDAPIHIGSRLTMVGHEAGTAFLDTLTIDTMESGEWAEPDTELRKLNFSGTGGTGLEARAPVSLWACRFTGWDVAAQAVNGGWIFCQEDTCFDRNDVALWLNSDYSISCGSNINGTSFTRNGVALQLEQIPGERMRLILDYCTFYGNETDIENPRDYVVELRSTTGVR